ncbi:MAG: DUF3800 domain-containing protein [Patescibacteria group bacterium]
MKTLFVDESGNLGTKDRYFVLVLFAPQRSKRVVNFMRKFCATNKLSEVKASRLSFPQKQEIFNKLCSANDYTISYIVADKQNIDNKKLFEDKNLCYNYLFSFLVKKTIKSSPEDLSILLDNHSTKVGSINSLSDYIKIKAFTQFGYQHNLQIAYTNSEHSKVVQAVDVIANAIWAHYNYGASHFYNMLTISESIRFPQNKFGQNLVIPTAPISP